MTNNRRLIAILSMWMVHLAGFPRPATSADFVYVGDAGNTADSSGYGSVSRAYAIGRFEFTSAQYVQFLNAVDPQGTNPNGIWNANMASSGANSTISFTSGNADGSKYAVFANKANTPAVFVSWFDVARVANWYHNGSLTYATTSSGSAAINTGAYTLNGATSGTAPAPNAGAQYWIPTENEWYKAAYYKGGGTNAGYWTYATQSNAVPTAVAATAVGSGTSSGVSPVVSGNYANWNHTAIWNGSAPYGIATAVGTNGGQSAYGTFDMTGNAFEWNDVNAVSGTVRQLRGGSFGSTDAAGISSSFRLDFDPAIESTGGNVGFRLASTVPTSLTWNTTSGTWGVGNLNWTNGTGNAYTLPAGSAATFTNASGGTITLSGTMQPTAVSVSAASGIYVFSTSTGNVIAGSGALTKSGGGVLVLSGSNAYSGGTTLSAGTLRAGDDDSLGTGTMTLSGGTFASADASARSFSNAVSITGDTTLGDATGTGSLTFSGAVGLGGAIRTLTTTSNVVLSGAISNGGLTKTGLGTLTLSGTNTYSGGTTVSAGSLVGTTASLQGAITNNAAVTFSQAIDGTYAGAMSGIGSLTKSGAGAVTLSGTNTYSGGTTVSAGSLVGTTASLQGAITNNAAVTFSQAISGTYSGAMSGIGSLTKSGAGAVTLAGTNSFSGGTTLSAGTLVLGNADALGTAGTIALGGGTLRFTAGNTTDYSSRFSTAAGQAYNLDTNGQSLALASGLASSGGSLTKTGLGTLTLSGTSTYGGATTVSAGVLSVTGRLGTTTVTVAGGATIGGTGTLDGDLLLDGFLAPGAGGFGLLEIGSLTLHAGSTTALEIAGLWSGPGVAGTTYDSIVTRRGLEYGGSLALSFLGNPLFDNGTVLDLFQSTGAPTGMFTAISTPAGGSRYSGLSFQRNPNGNWYTPDTADRQYLIFSPATGRLAIVPEPSTWALLPAALAAGAWRLTRRRRPR